MTPLDPVPDSTCDDAGGALSQRTKRRRIDLYERPELVLVPSFFLIIVVAWQFLTTRLGISDNLLPRPSRIAAALVTLVRSPEFWTNFRVTTTEALAGFGVATVAAIVLGTLISQLRIIERTVLPYVVAFQTVPKVALAPLFLIWFGFGQASKIVMAMIIAFFPILINVIAGLKSADDDQIEMLTSFGASRFQIFRMVRLQSALPFIFAGLQIGIVFSILGAIVGEFIGAKEGLGYQLLQANYNFDTASLFAVLVVLSLLGLLFHWIIRVADRRIVFWTDSGPSTGA